MHASLRSLLLYVISAALGLAACARQPTGPAPTATPDARSAAVSEIVKVVEARAADVAAFTPVSVGYVLGTGGQVRTGHASQARLDLSDGTILRLAQDSSFSLQDVTPIGSSVFARLKLGAGKIWVSLRGGALQVETPVGVASVRGSFAVIQYSPGDPDNPDDDLLVLDCLEGACLANNDNVNTQLGNLERVALNRAGQLRMRLTGADVLDFLQHNPEGQGMSATLTAAPPATATLTPSPTPSPRRSPTTKVETATPVNATATPLFLPTATETSAPPAAPVAPPLSAPIIGQHVVQSGETLFCIGRGYGVLPTSIAQANGLPALANIFPGQILLIPAAQWVTIAPGPVCPPQFASPFPSLAATSTPIPTVIIPPTITPTPTATCEPGSFYDPFQKRCRPPDATAPAVTETPTAFLPPPEVTETPTFTPPDVTGPDITHLNADPTTVDTFTICTVTFTADVSDPAGVASAAVEWASYDNAQGTPAVIGTGSEPMSLISNSAATYQVQFDVMVLLGGYLEWKVAAVDNEQNASTSGVGPRIQTSDSDCGAAQ